MKIVCTTGELRGLKYKLNQGTINVGRSPENDIVIADQSCSRKQAFFLVTETEVNLINLSREHPLLINGRDAETHVEVQCGDCIHFGNSVWLAYADDSISPLTPGFKGNEEVSEAVKRCLEDGVTHPKDPSILVP